MDKPMTVAQSNNQSLRGYLRLRRQSPQYWGPAQQQHLEKLLEARRRYRSDDLIPIWVLDCGSEGHIYYDNEDDLQDWIQDWDEPASIETNSMTGREFGELPIWDG